MMKKNLSVLFIVLFAMLCAFSGCNIKSKTDITIREAVTVVGVDQVDDKIRLTITIELVQPSEGDDSTSKVAIYTAEGTSMFEAIQKYHAYTDKIIFWGHVNYILIGEETAKLGINKYLDLFARDHEIKQNIELIVVQESSAEDFIKDTNLKDATLNDVLQSLFDDAKNAVHDNEVTVLQYLQMVSCKKNCLYLPVVKTTDKKEKNEDDEGKKDAYLNGYSLFDDDTLTEFLGDDMANGANWIIDETHSGYMTIEDEQGDLVVLEVTKNNAKFDIDFSGDIPKVLIEVDFKSNIVEYHGSKNIFKNDEIEYLSKEQNKYVEKQIAETVQFLQKTKLDILGISNAIYIKYPKKTTQYDRDDNWSELFHKTEISIKVKSSIDRTYNINQPVAHDEGEEQK